MHVFLFTAAGLAPAPRVVSRVSSVVGTNAIDIEIIAAIPLVRSDYDSDRSKDPKAGKVFGETPSQVRSSRSIAAAHRPLEPTEPTNQQAPKQQALLALSGGGEPSAPVPVTAQLELLKGPEPESPVAGNSPGKPCATCASDHGVQESSIHADQAIYARLTAHLRARAQRCYPRAALRREIEGTALVRLCVDRVGTPRGLRLVESSGSPLLDEAAIECVVREAAPLPIVPECVVLPIDFRRKR